ncbi:MAG: NADH-quinone oxidoreductase subunit NuoK [Candidatus Dadabacteria bacterium]|nr:MAG: NADH-quinone oxidoreductase subunit NuoK [Candidatus Dadabacteria bacterium]
MGALTTGHFIALSAVLFSIGAVGVVLRKNVIVIFMCIEIMLNAVNISFVALAREAKNLEGEVMVLFVMVVAAAEAAVALALVIALFRNKQTTDVEEASELKL